MNILFNASQCGLGNNGGSKTIIRSAETLNNIGHKSLIWVSTNNYTWHKPSCPTVKYYGSGADVVVSVSVWDVESTIEIQCENKVWWMRGWESWYKGEQYLIDTIKAYVDQGGKIIVNSSWLIKQLKDKCGVESELCWSGLDLDVWEDVDFSTKPHCFARGQAYSLPLIGGLGKRKHETKRYDLYKKLQEKCKSWYGEYNKNIELGESYNDKELLEMYQSCNIWFAPTELEGFHNVPAEANLCGCLVFCNRLDSNGMGDFATEETAERYSSWDELLSKLENPDFSKVPKMQKLLKEKIGSREKNMERMVGLLI